MRKLSEEQIAAYVIDIIREDINNIYGQEPTEEEQKQIEEAREVLHDKCYQYIWDKSSKIVDDIMCQVDELRGEIYHNQQRWYWEREETNEDKKDRTGDPAKAGHKKNFTNNY